MTAWTKWHPVLACIVNGGARSNTAAQLSDRVAALFREGRDHRRQSRPRADAYCPTLCRRWLPTIVAAGGDGTVNAVASALVGTQAALGVIPLGTLNHFAKDAGIPLDLDAAIDTVIRHHQLVDVGELNGHIINNSSIGLYPAMCGALRASAAG